ncbi:MAG TPA: DUF3619 family protein [Casimicrobiaceae bacterium]|nr:DUF3619 family protein [Casimicrobiaceae bacterium]
MNAWEDDFGKKVKGMLDQGSGELRAGVGYRLQQARAAALERANAQAVAAVSPELAVAGTGRAPASRPVYLQPRMWLALGILVAGIVGYEQWTAWQHLRELEDLDAQILTSDLPIDAYLDRGFQHWLKTSKSDE